MEAPGLASWRGRPDDDLYPGRAGRQIDSSKLIDDIPARTAEPRSPDCRRRDELGPFERGPGSRPFERDAEQLLFLLMVICGRARLSGNLVARPAPPTDPGGD